MMTEGSGLLSGRCVLVTGASSGIGRAIAIGAARAGANVVINYLDEHDRAETCLAAIRAAGGQGVAVAGDVADPASASALVDAALDQFGRVDALVSNAGICPFHALLDMPLELLDRTIAVNLRGSYLMVQAAARAMVSAGNGGSIIAISSISALVGGGMQTHYTPTKAGVLSLMQSAAVALGPHGIRCNALLPGTIETDINRGDLADAEKRKRMEARVPLGRLGEPEDLVGPALFLMSDMARYVTGSALLVDGGAFVNLQ